MIPIVIVVKPSKPAPSGATGYIIWSMGLARTAKPTQHGNIINIDVKNENESFFLALCMSFFAMDVAIAGTKAEQNAAFKASGKCIIVSTFERIPS